MLVHVAVLINYRYLACDAPISAACDLASSNEARSEVLQTHGSRAVSACPMKLGFFERIASPLSLDRSVVTKWYYQNA